MKTNTIQAIITTVALGLGVAIGGTQLTGNHVVGLAVTVSYLAVVALLAIAASDYKTAPKAYSVPAVAKSHFKRSAPASVVLRASAAKARLAA
jgi:ABC-type Na+ efflux pump permease subunit